MKDSEFIELLNLYLDHEISPAKAAELEAEVAQNPARRAVYRQYCRMQKACVVLAEKFEGDAPVQVAAPSFRPARRGTVGIWATGFMAAACAALAIITRLHPAAPAAAAASAVAQAAPAAAPAPLAHRDFHPVFVARALAPNAQPAASGVLFSASDPNGEFAWMQQLQMTPIARQAATPYLLAKPALDLDNSMDAGRSAGSNPTEKAAFQFQR